MGGKNQVRNGDTSRFEVDRLRTLLDISQSLHASINLDDLLLYIVSKTKKLVGAQTVAVLLHDASAKEFFFRIPEASPDTHETRLEEIRFPDDKGIAASVFTNATPELILDVAHDPRHYRVVDGNTGFKTKSLMAVPLQTKHSTIGVLEACNKISGTFAERDLDCLLMIANTVAMALDNARIHEALEKTHRQLQLAHTHEQQLVESTLEENYYLRRELEGRNCPEQIVGNSPRILSLLQDLGRVLTSDVTVLIEGETGTGKELLARCLHYNGPRKARPFVTQNCGAIPEALLASELFGHRKGAFTGAIAEKRGAFEVADGGTIFLDEVAETPPLMQVSLLRALQEGEIKPLGAEQCKKVNVRMISATNRDLENDVKNGRFREDLYYRLKVFSIKVPPLREREDDVPVLADHFLRKFNRRHNKLVQGFSRESLECLSAYSFPGNVRELENEIERAVVLVGDGKCIEIYHLSKRIRKALAVSIFGPGTHGTLKEMVESLERKVLSEMLVKHGNNNTRIARELGLSRFGLMKKLKRYGL
jgi:transcriptional regulator with GAF, ATPase, and Fis domain